MTTKVLDHCYDLGVKDQGQINLKSVLQLVTRTPLSFLTHMPIFREKKTLLAMCMLQRRLKIIAMTLVKVKYTKNQRRVQ